MNNDPATHLSTAPDAECSFFDVKTISGGVHVCNACGDTMPSSWMMRMRQAIGIRRFERLNAYRLNRHSPAPERVR